MNQHRLNRHAPAHAARAAPLRLLQPWLHRGRLYAGALDRSLQAVVHEVELLLKS